MSRQITQEWRVALFYSIFALFFGSGIAINVWGPTLGIGTADPPITCETSISHFTSDAVWRIETSEEFRAEISSGRCVLFVDCEWNFDVVAFRRPFAEFAAWCRQNTDYKTLSLVWLPLVAYAAV